MKWMWRRWGVGNDRRRLVRVGFALRAMPPMLAAGLVACSAASPSAPPLSLAGATPASRSTVQPAPENARVMVRLRDPSVDRAAVAAQAQAVAGVPVKATGAVTPEWQALTLDCADAAACDAAVARLRADTGRYLLVEIDRRASTLPVPRDRALAK